MKIYSCDCCGFKTRKLTNYNAHLKTKKHLKKIVEQNGSIGSNGSISFIDPSISPKIIKEYRCLYCQKNFSKNSHMHRHMKKCKLKKNIEVSGLYIMWNHKMVDEEGNMYYKLGRTSHRKSRIYSYASEYGIKAEEVKFLYEVEVKNEILGEKLLFNILENFRIDKVRELFKVPFELARQALDDVSYTMMKHKYDKLPELSQDKIDILMNYEKKDEEDDSDCDSDIDKLNYNTYLYLKDIINGDYELIKETKEKKEKYDKKIFNCRYCEKVFNKRSGKSRHEKKFCKKRDLSKTKDNDILLIVKKQIEDQNKKLEDNFKKQMEEQKEENKRLAKELELVKNRKSVPSVVNNIVTDKMMLVQLNKMPPKKFLNKYCYNTPTLDDLIKFVQEEKITLSDANRIKGIADSQIEKRKVYLNYYYRNVIIIIQNCTKRLIEMKEIKDSYCDSTFILNDSNIRHYMEKKEYSWENNTDINKVCKIISIIGSQVNSVYNLNCPILSKDDELFVAKEILKLNDWSNKKDILINSINKDDILMTENIIKKKYEITDNKLIL